MPDYSYEALAKTGLKQTGTLSAGSEREAITMLDARGLFPIKITSAGNPSTSGGFGFFSGVSKREIATVYAQMADLLHAGVPLLRSLEILEKQGTNKRLSAIMRDVRLKVADGTNLAQAMAAHPKVFDELAVSMVRAGQEGGFLEDVLKRIATFVEHQEDLKAKVVGALAYPVFLAVAGTLVLNILVIFFVPMFEPIFEKLAAKGELPVLTTYLIGFSHFQQSWLGAFSLVGAIVGFIAFVRWTRGSGRRIADAARLKIPLFGKIFLGLALSRFTRILGTMLHNGIPLLKSLTIAKDSTGNRVLAEAVEKSADSVMQGQKLADPLRRSPHFPSDVVEMIAVGEEANNLEEVLLNISNTLEQRTYAKLELFVRLLEPVMLLCMAVVILFIMIALLLPVFKSSGAL